jgi:hypothetical protein
MMTIPIGLTCMITAQLLNTDYGAWGVIAIMSCYLVSLFLRKWNGVRFSAAVVPLMLSNFLEGVAFLGLPALLFYGGKKGKNLNKWFFYFFYPVHLLLLALLRLLVYGA